VLPKEHGAYGQLLFPLITAMAVGRPRLAAWSFAAAALCAFLSHEPLLILIGHRGARAQRERQDDAVRWFAALATLAAVFFAIAFVRMTPLARVTATVPAALALVLAALIFTRRERTTIGEALTATMLASAAIPVAVASDASMTAALTCAAAFAAGFVAATVCVRAVIAHTRNPPAARARTTAIVATAVVLSAVAALAAFGIIRSIAPLAAAPLILGAIALAAVPPSSRQLRIVGWTLVATTAATSLVLIAALRYY
jgi:hypothetical protein